MINDEQAMYYYRSSLIIYYGSFKNRYGRFSSSLFSTTVAEISRFAASGMTMDCGLSITSSVKLIVCGIHPFGKRVGHCLWQWPRMGSPGHYYFRAGCLFVFFDGDQVGKALQRMTGSCFHREHRASGMLYELIDDHFIIVILTVFEAGKRTYTDDVTITYPG